MGFQWEGGHFSVATQLGAQTKTNAQFLAAPIPRHVFSLLAGAIYRQPILCLLSRTCTCLLFAPPTLSAEVLYEWYLSQLLAVTLHDWHTDMLWPPLAMQCF